MATHNIKMAKVQFPIGGAVTVALQRPTQLLDEAQFVFHPIRSQVVELDPFVVRKGWPLELPPINAQSRSFVDVGGAILEHRPAPQNVETGAFVRWIASAETFDDVDYTWVPTFSEAPYVWKSSADFAPTLAEDFQYAAGKEVIIRDAINFDATNQEHMWSQFQAGLEGTSGYTVLMVVWLNSTLGNTEERRFMGIWGPGTVVPDPEETEWDESANEGFALLLEDLELVVDTENGENHVGMPAQLLIETGRPIYLAVSFSYPTSTIWAGLGPDSLQRFYCPVGDVEHFQEMNVILGRSNGSLIHTADMAIFDLGIYSSPLTDGEVRDQISLLSQSYGI